MYICICLVFQMVCQISQVPIKSVWKKQTLVYLGGGGELILYSTLLYYALKDISQYEEGVD